jgi:hypothetical protein
VIIVASRKRLASWLWRDASLVYILIVWVAFVFSLIFYFSAWPLTQRPSATKVEAKNEAKDQANDGQLYTGSIVFVPSNGDFCWLRMLDNRTGRFWDKGFSNCYDVVTDLKEQKQRGQLSILRMQEVSKVFRHANN